MHQAIHYNLFLLELLRRTLYFHTRRPSFRKEPRENVSFSIFATSYPSNTSISRIYLRSHVRSRPDKSSFKLLRSFIFRREIPCSIPIRAHCFLILPLTRKLIEQSSISAIRRSPQRKRAVVLCTLDVKGRARELPSACI